MLSGEHSAACTIPKHEGFGGRSVMLGALGVLARGPLTAARPWDEPRGRLLPPPVLLQQALGPASWSRSVSAVYQTSAVCVGSHSHLILP